MRHRHAHLRIPVPRTEARNVPITPASIVHGFCATRLGTILYGSSSRPTHSKRPHPFGCAGTSRFPDGGRFTDDRYAPLLESSRQLIALIRSRSLSTGLPQRASTVAGYFQYLRELLRWMDQAGFTRFADLDAHGAVAVPALAHERPGIARAALAPTTVQKYLYLLTYLYRFRNDLDDGLQVDPFPGRSHGEVAGVHDAEIRRWPYTPDGVAVALVQRAIDLVTNGAADILQARQVYATAMALGQPARLWRRRLHQCGNACAARGEPSASPGNRAADSHGR